MHYSKFYRGTAVSALALALLVPAVAQAQDATQTDQAAVPQDQATTQDATTTAAGDEVVVTGSRIKRRSQTEGPAPVTIVTTEQMRKNGFSTVYDALQTVTEATGGVQNDYDWGQSSVNAYPLNLRNLGPGRTLLLVNGHRVADYPMPYQGKSNFANFNNLPTGIVNRVEILSGSASAIYGSDAMGGVVNVLLNEEADGHTARFRYGGATRGGRRNWEAVFSGGFSGSNWNLLYNLQHYDRGTLLAKDRPFMDEESDVDPASRSVAAKHFGIGYVNPYPGLYLRDYDRPSSAGTAYTYINPPAGACEQYGDLYFRAQRLTYDRNSGAEGYAGDYCAQRVFGNWALRTGSKDDSGYLHGNIDLGGVEAWASAGLWKTTGGFNTFLDGFASGNFWDPRANDGAGGTRYFLKFQSPEEMGGEDAVMTRSKERALDISAGLKGKVLGDRFDWEVYGGRATYNIRESFPVLDQSKMFDYYMGPQLGDHNGLGIYTPDYDKLWNPVPSSDIAAFSDRGVKKAKSWLNQAQAVLSGKLFDGWAGPIQMAAVLEAGKQGYLLTPEPKTLPENQGPEGWYTPFGNIEQGGGSRKRYAAGLELDIPLLSSLNLSTAGRWDKYDAVASDSAFTYQLGLEFRPTRTMMLRGSYGTSFRAPDMHFVYAKASTGIADFTDYSKCFELGRPDNTCNRGSVGDPMYINDATVARQGTPDLLYEKGKSLTAGIVWDAFRNFSASLDYWRINVNNLIDDVDANQVLLDEGYCRYGMTPDGSPRNPAPSAALCDLQISRVHRNAEGVVTQIDTGPINRAETRVAGIDAKVSYAIPNTPMGSWTLGANYTLLLDYRSRQFPTDELDNTVKTQNPRYRFNANVGVTSGKWNGALYMYQKGGGRNNRWDQCASFPDGFRPSEGNDCKDLDPLSPTYGQSTKILKQYRQARRYFNGSMGYQLNKMLKLNLYVSNIFDIIYGDKYCGDFAYCVDDPVGREVSGEIVVKF